MSFRANPSRKSSYLNSLKGKEPKDIKLGSLVLWHYGYGIYSGILYGWDSNGYTPLVLDISNDINGTLNVIRRLRPYSIRTGNFIIIENSLSTEYKEFSGNILKEIDEQRGVSILEK